MSVSQLWLSQDEIEERRFEEMCCIAGEDTKSIRFGIHKHCIIYTKPNTFTHPYTKLNNDYAPS